MSGHELYKLDDDKTPIRITFEEFLEADAVQQENNVAETFLLDGRRVSTVFLGINLNIRGNGPPILFETMVFSPDGKSLDYQRCSTWAQAEAQHARMVAELGVPKLPDNLCAHCHELIDAVDLLMNTRFHLECLVRMTAGSVAHQKGTCTCHGGEEADPPGASLREAARAAYEHFLKSAPFRVLSSRKQ